MNSAAKWESAAKWGCSLPLVIIALLPFIGYPLREFRTSDGRKALLPGATNVEEDLVHGIFGGDHTRLLKASLPAERYSDYAKSLHLTERFDPQMHRSIETTLNIKIDAPVWWNPPEVDSTTYFQHKQGDDYLRVLRYHHGSIYYLVMAW